MLSFGSGNLLLLITLHMCIQYTVEEHRKYTSWRLQSQPLPQSIFKKRAYDWHTARGERSRKGYHDLRGDGILMR